MDQLKNLDLDQVSAGFVDFLNGTFPYSSELQSFWMAFQGAMIVRNGPNKDRHMHWFHAFMLSVIAGYGGAAFGFIWMGKPSSMLSNDLNMASCIFTFLFVNYLLPWDLGYKIGNFLPVVLVTTSFAQLFRSLGLVKFVGVAFEDLKHNPSRYYPIPVFGPIIYGTLLGNMSSFFLKGFHEHLAYGMPWPFQNGLFCATLYHFYVNDTTGPVGKALRHFIQSSTLLSKLQGGLDDRTFATAAVSLFMQIVGFLHLPFLLGPSFSPFAWIQSIVQYPFRSSTGGTTTTSGAPSKPQPSKPPRVDKPADIAAAMPSLDREIKTAEAPKRKRPKKKSASAAAIAATHQQNGKSSSSSSSNKKDQ